MNRRQKKRLTVILAILVVLGMAASLLLYALRQNINLFYTPTSALAAHLSSGQVVRIGGYVERHSVHYTASGDSVHFRITDWHHTLSVTYHGVLPTLFREGQGIVVTGTLTDSEHFMATQVLAKHDEKYMPPVLKEITHAS